MTQYREFIQAKFDEYIIWLSSRKFANNHPQWQKNILDLSHSTGVMPDAKLSVEMSAFNSVLCGLEPELFVPFVKTYGKRHGMIKKPVKSLAYDLGISDSTFMRNVVKADEKFMIHYNRLIAFYADARALFDSVKR